MYDHFAQFYSYCNKKSSTLRLISFAISLIFLLHIPASAQSNSCQQYGADGNGCDVCFNAGKQKVGEKFNLNLYFKSTSKIIDYLFFKEDGVKLKTVPLQSAVEIGVTKDFKLLFDDKIIFLGMDDKNGYIFFPNSEIKLMKMEGAMLITSATGKEDRKRPVLRFEYSLDLFEYDFDTHQLGSKKVQTQCTMLFLAE